MWRTSCVSLHQEGELLLEVQHTRPVLSMGAPADGLILAAVRAVGAEEALVVDPDCLFDWAPKFLGVNMPPRHAPSAVADLL